MILKKIFLYTIAVFSFILLTVVNAFAQPGSGGDPLPCDPDATCPIDNWVVAFSFFALILTMTYLRKRETKTIMD